MSIFKRSSGNVQQATPPATEAGQTAAPTAGVVPPPAAPIYSMRPPEASQGEAESVVAEKVRIAREAQQSAQARVRQAVRRARTTAAPPPGAQRRVAVAAAPVAPRTMPPTQVCEPIATAQAGLRNLAWRWQEAGAPIRAIHAYMDLLQRYPGTPIAAAAVSDLVELSERLADEGQFHIALAIYEQLENLECTR